ncbi:MAG: acyltransferase [Deltaproteobacteria bacterium]|nr:acyltransferase [Deltaproteobacteria bacterium]
MSAFERLALKVKRGEGPVFHLAHRLAKGVLNFHLPDNPAMRSLARAAYMGHVMTREAAEKLRGVLWAEPLFRARCAKVGEGLTVERVPYVLGHAEIIIGDNVTISGQLNVITGRFSDRPQLIIGDNVFLGHNVVISVNRKVEIRDNASVAGGVRIADSDGHPSDWQRRADEDELQDDEMQPVVIGEHAWIGTNAQILKGITIGEHSIVGAGSVVISDVPADTLAMGSPARKVRMS